MVVSRALLRRCLMVFVLAGPLSGTVHGAVTLTPDPSYPASPKLFTIDPETLTPSGRGVTGTRQLRQTFQLSQSIDVDGIVLSLAGTGTDGGLVIRFYEIADVNASSWSAGTFVKTISLDTAVDLPSSSARLGLSLSGPDVFTLPKLDAGTSGYGVEISNFDGTSTIGSIRHSNNGVDNYASGKFYIEDGSHSGTGNRDIGLALTGTVNTNLGTWFVAPTGDDNNPGTLAEPFASITKAQSVAASGDTVYLRGGTYASFAIASSNATYNFVHHLNKSGISYLAYPGDARPVFDFSSVSPESRRVTAFLVTGSSNRFEDFDVTGVQVGTQEQSECWRINSGDGNTFRRLVMRDCAGTGIYIQQTASNTLVENCDAYNLIGVAGISAGNIDGFGCHSSGAGNTFRGCRAWACSDDGFDSISAAGAVTYERCWAFDNGRFDGNKVGFKVGGWGCSGRTLPPVIPVHTVRFCLSVSNGASGFYANHQPGQSANWYNNTAYANAGGNYNMLEGENNSDQCSVDGYREVMHNNIAYVGTATVNLDESASGAIVTNNTWNLSVGVSDSDFQSVDATEMTQPRQADGSLPDIAFLHLASGSDLIDAGVDLGFPYAGAAPDLGCFESSAAGATPPVIHSFSALGNGGFRLNFSGTAGQFYEVRATTNLLASPITSWTLLSSGTFNGSAVVFDDLQATNFAQRYYLIRLP